MKQAQKLPLRHQLANWLPKLREFRGWSQDNLAQWNGVDGASAKQGVGSRVPNNGLTSRKWGGVLAGSRRVVAHTLDQPATVRNNTRKLRVIAFPKTGIAYNEPFYGAVEALHVEVLEGDFSGRWILRHVQRGDFVHVHWPSFLYASPSKGALFRRFTRFLALLALIEARGAKLLWTAHNLMPHDRSVVPLVDVLARKVVIALSHRVLVHGPTAAGVLQRRFPSTRRKLVTIHHGHWIDYYPRQLSQAEARRKLGLTESEFVYAFVGICKEYKNLDVLIDCFTEISDGAKLVIAGQFQSEVYRKKITSHVGAHPSIKFYPEFIPDEELQIYLMACDVVVLPYRDILTSGTAMLAMSFGRPVVSVDVGYLKDVVTGQTGILYDPYASNGLRKALVAVRHRKYDERAILDHATTFDWGDSAREFVTAIAPRQMSQMGSEHNFR